jgi:hypothetical protein
MTLFKKMLTANPFRKSLSAQLAGYLILFHGFSVFAIAPASVGVGVSHYRTLID